jgi:hypothetical protein
LRGQPLTLTLPLKLRSLQASDLTFRVIKTVRVGDELQWSYIKGKKWQEGNFTALTHALFAASAGGLKPSQYFLDF